MGVDKAFKRQQFLALKAAADNGQLIPAKRKKFSPKVRREVLAAQEGLCAACEERIFGRYDIDHILEHDLGGSDEPLNLVALHPECHRPKTSARAPVLAKVHRLAKATFGEPDDTPSRIRSNPKIQSAGFRKDVTKGFDQKVRPRKARTA